MTLTKVMYMYSKPDCTWCDKASILLKNYGYETIKFNITTHDGAREFFKGEGFKTVPQIYNGNIYIGGYTELEKYLGHV